MKNTLGDLNNHLFEQLERLNDDDLSAEQLEREIQRSAAMTRVASQIVSNGHLVLKAKTIYEEHIDADGKKPKMLEG